MVQPDGNKVYYFGIDGLRFLAVCLAASFHLCFWSWAQTGSTPNLILEGATRFDALTSFIWFGWAGVEIFFVISGLVIANSANGRTPIVLERRNFAQLGIDDLPAVSAAHRVRYNNPAAPYRCGGGALCRAADRPRFRHRPGMACQCDYRARCSSKVASLVDGYGDSHEKTASRFVRQRRRDQNATRSSTCLGALIKSSSISDRDGVKCHAGERMNARSRSQSRSGSGGSLLGGRRNRYHGQKNRQDAEQYGLPGHRLRHSSLPICER